MLLELATEPPAVAILEGEAGVGKTRLVRELLAHPALAGRCALVGNCHPLREPFPFGPMIEALRGAAAVLPRELSPVTGALRPLLPELSDRLPPLPEPLGDHRAERHRLFRAVPELLAALGPAVCVLEDLHWLDESTAELTSFLLAQLPPQLSLVLTFRREDLGASTPLLGITSRLPRSTLTMHLSLPPLDVEEVRKLVGAILEVDEVSEEFGAYVHERTLGIPFAVEEVLRLLEHRRDLVNAGGWGARRALDELAVPTAVRDSILERLGRLGPDAQRVGEAAAVLGTPATEEHLARVGGLSASRTRKGLSQALSVALLRELDAGCFGFRHTLACQAVYEAIPAPERRELHVRAALALWDRQGRVPLARLAHHFKLGGRSKEWLRYAEVAADQALSLGDDEAAARLLCDALETPGASSALRGRLAVKLGRAALGGFVAGEVVALLQRVLDEEPLPAGTRGEVRSYVGQLLLRAGEGSGGRRELLRAVPELERRPALAARVMLLLAVPSTGDAHVDEHLEWLRRANEVAAAVDDPELTEMLRKHQAWILSFTGDSAAREALAEVPSSAESLEERRRLSGFYGSVAYATAALGHYREAKSLLARASALADPHDVYGTSSQQSTRLAIDWATGRWEGLDLEAQRLLKASTDSGVALLEAGLVLGLLSLSRGDLDAADAHLGDAAKRALAAGWLPTLATAVGGHARLSLARGNPEAAAEKALNCLDSIMRRKGIWVWAADVAPVAVDSLLALGQNNEARQLVKELAEGLRNRDAPLAWAALLVCRGAIDEAEGRFEPAARAYASARRAWDELPRPSEAAVAAEAEGRSLLAQGDRRGEQLLSAALASFERLGAFWDVRRVRRTLREHGVELPSGGRKPYGTRLSPREEQVVRLAAAGRSNREIAEELVLSPRTVEGHVARAMRKLGIHSRRALRTSR